MQNYLLTEQPIYGKIPKEFTNMRLEYVWARHWDAILVPLEATHLIREEPDKIIIILPKINRSYDKIPLSLKKKYKKSKIIIMQEGPIDYWKNWSLNEADFYFNVLKKVDEVWVHNKIDKIYIEELLGLKNVYVNPTLIDVSKIKNWKVKNNNKILLSGGFSSWYNGMEVFQILKQLKFKDITVPINGRTTKEELEFLKKNKIKTMKWMNWNDWINGIHKFGIGINLMTPRAAGTFNLACGTLGIPCIGRIDLDTQRILFPELSIVKDDLKSFKNLLIKLKKDKKFRQNCSIQAKQKAKQFYLEE